MLADSGGTMRRTITWPDGKLICATFTVAFEAFTKGGHFKKKSDLEVNLASVSHANYGGNVGIWRIMEICERAGARGAIETNRHAGRGAPARPRAARDAGHEIAGHGTTNDIVM